MRTIRMAFAGFIVFLFLSSAPAIAAKAAVVHYPGQAVQTYQQARAVYFYAANGGGGNLNQQVPEFMGEGVIASLIIVFGIYAADARKKGLDARRRLYSELESALTNFREQFLTIRFNRNKGYEISDSAWGDLNAAKARVNAAADTVLDNVRAGSREANHARQSKEETSDMLKALENPPDPT